MPMPFDDDSKAYFQYRGYLRESYLRRIQLMTRFTILLVLFMPVLLATILLIPPLRGILHQQEQTMSAKYEGMKKIPDLEQKLAKLESQINLLTTESINIRLQTIEKAINVGGLNTEDVATVVNIKKDMDLLKTYMFSDPKKLVELNQLQRNYANLAESQSLYATKDSLDSKIGTLQTILTISLSFFGIIFTVVFGSWWFISRKATPIMQPTRPVHPPPPDSTTSREISEDEEVTE